MNYSCIDKKSGKAISIYLGGYSLKVSHNGQEEIIPYGIIQWVRLKKTRNDYTTVIKPSGMPEIIISCRVGIEDYNEKVNQYTSFLRVLHYHLREKSKADFRKGEQLISIFSSILGSVLIAFGITFMLSKQGVSIVSKEITMFILSALFAVVVLSIKRNNMPGSYEPDQIPNDYLPG